MLLFLKLTVKYFREDNIDIHIFNESQIETIPVKIHIDSLHRIPTNNNNESLFVTLSHEFLEVLKITE